MGPAFLLYIHELCHTRAVFIDLAPWSIACKTLQHMRGRRFCCFGKSIIEYKGLFLKCLPFPSFMCSVKQQQCHCIILQNAIHASLHMEIYLKKTSLWGESMAELFPAARAHLVSVVFPLMAPLKPFQLLKSEIWIWVPPNTMFCQETQNECPVMLARMDIVKVCLFILSWVQCVSNP